MIKLTRYTTYAWGPDTIQSIDIDPKSKLTLQSSFIFLKDGRKVVEYLNDPITYNASPPAQEFEINPSIGASIDSQLPKGVTLPFVHLEYPGKN